MIIFRGVPEWSAPPLGLCCSLPRALEKMFILSNFPHARSFLLPARNFPHARTLLQRKLKFAELSIWIFKSKILQPFYWPLYKNDNNLVQILATGAGLDKNGHWSWP